MHDLIKIELTKEQAALFVLFQGHYDKIGFCIAEGVFDMAGGSATLNFAPNGELKSIKKETFAYNKTPVNSGFDSHKSVILTA